MKKTLLILSSLIILSACSNGSLLPNGVTGTGNSILDAGLKESLIQIGSTQGLTQWNKTNQSEREGLTIKETINYFLGEDTFKFIAIQAVDGTRDGIIFTDEVFLRNTSEGSLLLSSNFTVLDDNNTDLTQEFTDKGYTYIATFIPNKVTAWESKKIGGTEIPEELTINDNDTRAYIIKKTNTELALISSIEKLAGIYTIYTTVDEEIKYANIYKKQ
ncbi:MAG: hypothetical protein ACRCWI_03400 [Brevinema sp.]